MSVLPLKAEMQGALDCLYSVAHPLWNLSEHPCHPVLLHYAPTLGEYGQ